MVNLIGKEAGTSTIFPETADIETSSDAYASRFSGSVGEWFLRIQADASLGMLLPDKVQTVLDVGGGHGQLTGPLLQAGYQVTVLGSAEICMQRIQSLVDGQRCMFEVGNILNLPYSDQSFDAVVSYRLLPHVVQWQKFLAELARVARKVILLDYPEVRSINYLTPYLFKYKKNLEGNTRTYTCFRDADLVRFFQGLGYSLADRYAEFFIPMVMHRSLKNAKLSSVLENISRSIGLTTLFGSPVILKFIRRGGLEYEGLINSSSAFL